MAEDQPDIVAMTEVNPNGRSYKIEDIKIRCYITFEYNLNCVGRCGVVVIVHSSHEHSVGALEEIRCPKNLYGYILNYRVVTILFSVMCTVVQ